MNITIGKLTLRVKVGLAVGKMFAYYLEANCRNHVAVVGPAVKDVNKAEGCAVAGNIICSSDFFLEIPDAEMYPHSSSKKGFIQLWPPKNNAKSAAMEFIRNHKDGKHVILDRNKIIQKISDDFILQDLLKRYIPDFMRFQLEEGQSTGSASQVRSITTLFISLVLEGSDQVSADHNNVQEALYCIDEIVDKMNGMVNKIFTFDKGCTILAAFGTQGLKMKDDPRRALKSAEMIMRSLQVYIESFKGVSIGVTTGDCFVGVVGHQDRHEYTVIGHQVNKACRIMSNYPFCVACDEQTKKRSNLPDYSFKVLPPKVLKGVPPGELYFKYIEVGDDIVVTNYKEASGSSTRTARFIGRAVEIDTLYECIISVEKDSKPQNTIIVESQAGYGKTRLLRQFSKTAKSRLYRCLNVTLMVDEMTTPYFAIKIILYRLLGLDRPIHHKNKEGVIARFVPDYLRGQMWMLNELLGTRFVKNYDFENICINIQSFLNVLIHEIVGTRRYLITIDNAEYLDPQSWEFIPTLPSNKRRTILVLSMRSTGRKRSRVEETLMKSETTKHLVLGPFEENEIIEFGEAYLGVQKLPQELEKVLLKKTRGVPLYCESLLEKMLREKVCEKLL